MQRLDPAVHRVEVVVGQQAADGELEQRDPPRHQVLHGRVALGQPQFAGVHPLRGDGDVGLARERLVALERLQRGLLPRLVAVEGEDDLAAEGVVVHHQLAQHPHVLLAERGAGRGHRRGHPGLVQGHHVGVALDDDHLVAPGDLPLGLVQTEQHLRLLEDRALAGVQVLRLDGVIIEQAARAEPDDVAAPVPDRPHQPPVEAVDRAAPALLGDLRLVQLGQLEAVAQQVFGQLVPPAGGEPAAEALRRGAVETTFGEERARGLGLRGLQLLGVELLGGLVHLHQPHPGAPVAAGRGAAALVGQVQADPVGQALHRLHEREVLDLHDELDDVAALAAAEAVEGAVAGAHVERGRLLLVERAQALQRAPARAAQCDVLADDLVDPIALADLRDVALPDPSRHTPTLEHRPTRSSHGGGRPSPAWCREGLLPCVECSEGALRCVECREGPLHGTPGGPAGGGGGGAYSPV